MEDEEFLCHYGVLGMKWGRRKAERGGLPSERRLKKKIAKANKNPSRNKNTIELYNKAWDEIGRSKEAKRYSNALNKFDKKSVNGIYMYNKKEQKLVKNLSKDFEKKKASVFKKYEDAFAGAMIKDLGYKDTQAGREYLKKKGLV